MMRSFCPRAAAALMFCSGILLAQQGSVPALAQKEVPGLRITREASYDGKSLWGYIDGGADVYLEYGFTNVLARKAQVENIGFQIDLYKMQDPLAAYGIFSISAFNCARSDKRNTGDSLARYQCLTRYQAQAVRGPYYLSVINDKGTSTAQALGTQIARTLLAQIDTAGEDAALPGLFSLEPLRALRAPVKFMKGLLGVQNGAPELDHLFAESASYRLYLMSARADSLDLTLALASFGTAEDRAHFLEKAGFRVSGIGTEPYQEKKEGAVTRRVWITPREDVVYLELKTPDAYSQRLKRAIDAAVKE